VGFHELAGLFDVEAGQRAQHWLAWWVVGTSETHA